MWAGNNGGKGASAPVGNNPFMAAPPMQAAQGPHGNADPTGPMLGRGSELRLMHKIPPTMGHQGSINCMAMVDGKVYSGGRDDAMFMWRGEPAPGEGGFQLTPDGAPIQLGQSVMSMFYEPASKWLFCGLWSGDILAFCKDPVTNDKLLGHRKSVNSITVHSSVVVSGSYDGTVRLWTMNPSTGRFQSHGSAIQNPTGPVNAVRVLNDGLWVGGHNGITCFDLASLQPRGTIPSSVQVTALLEFQGHMIASYRSGEVRIYDAGGSEAFYHPSVGEHTSNTAVELMMHPLENKPMLLCGQVLGYVTAYDLPEFRPRGSFVCKQGSDVKAILDVKADGMFLTGGLHGDLTVWQWTKATEPQGGASAPNPFAASTSVPVASNPFAAGASAGPPCGGMMPGAPCGGMMT